MLHLWLLAGLLAAQEVEEQEGTPQTGGFRRRQTIWPAKPAENTISRQNEALILLIA